MENGTELSKTVATFILQKILLDDTGLAYICQTYERFSHVAMILVMFDSIDDELFHRKLLRLIERYWSPVLG